MRAHMAEHGLPESAVRRQVRKYLDEIIPHFNVLSYYKVGHNLAKIVVNLLYKTSVDYKDERALERIPKRDVVVYLMNHRSNADYVVVAYVLARGVHVSYAVGEWARAWPLEYVFKSFGAYFVRRKFREPLYHTVLERYVQLITRKGVTQGIFPKAGCRATAHCARPSSDCSITSAAHSPIRRSIATSGSYRWRSTMTGCSKTGRSFASSSRRGIGRAG